MSLEEEVGKIPKSDSDIIWNATALAALKAQVTAVMDTLVPASPTAGGLNDMLSKAAGANTFDKATDSLEAIADAVAALAALLPTKTLNAANDTVQAGYYAATTLHTVDGNLATGNIKSGATIFGIAGAAVVQDISAANAAVGDVVSGKTFFSVTGAIKTGTRSP
jgi:hypothetical protein